MYWSSRGKEKRSWLNSSCMILIDWTLVNPAEGGRSQGLSQNKNKRKGAAAMTKLTKKIIFALGTGSSLRNIECWSSRCFIVCLSISKDSWAFHIFNIYFHCLVYNLIPIWKKWEKPAARCSDFAFWTCFLCALTPSCSLWQAYRFRPWSCKELLIDSQSS